MSTQAFAHMTSIPLAILGYAYAMDVDTFMYTPMQWKGNIPKLKKAQSIYTKEIVAGSDPKLFPMSKPDILDAIGIGRHHLKEIEFKIRMGLI